MVTTRFGQESSMFSEMQADLVVESNGATDDFRQKLVPILCALNSTMPITPLRDIAVCDRSD
jgi:hypothetical protein